MDGNGRWAEARGHRRIFGHVKGAKVAKSIIEECTRLKIPNLTLFAFSTENWLRPKYEVSFLMSLLRRYLQKERAELIAKNICFSCIGDLSRIPEPAIEEVLKTIEMTKHNTGMRLTFALSYGGRQEIINGVKEICKQVLDGKVKVEDITEASLSTCLNSSYLPDPDLIIRTSGETRLSNFFLWQAAYSELFFSKPNWPDFTTLDLHKALDFYVSKERRFGKTNCQIRNSEPISNLPQQEL